MIEWLLANKHLLPSMLIFFVGFIWIIKVPVLHLIKNGDCSALVNPAKLVLKPGKERLEIIAGVSLLLIGLASQLLITKLYGYYFVVEAGRKVFVHGSGLSFK